MTLINSNKGIGEVINIKGFKVEIKELITLIRKQLKIKNLNTLIKKELGLKPVKSRLFASNRKIKKIYKWKPKYKDIKSLM